MISWIHWATVQLVGIEHQQRPLTMYNFAVADFHSYAVKGEGVWVHNDPVCVIPRIPSLCTPAPLLQQGVPLIVTRAIFPPSSPSSPYKGWAGNGLTPAHTTKVKSAKNKHEIHKTAHQWLLFCKKKHIIALYGHFVATIIVARLAD